MKTVFHLWNFRFFNFYLMLWAALCTQCVFSLPPVDLSPSCTQTVAFASVEQSDLELTIRRLAEIYVQKILRSFSDAEITLLVSFDVEKVAGSDPANALEKVQFSKFRAEFLKILEKGNIQPLLFFTQVSRELKSWRQTDSQNDLNRKRRDIRVLRTGLVDIGEPVEHLEVSNDGKAALIAGLNYIGFWDLKRQKPFWQNRARVAFGYSPTMSANGERIARVVTNPFGNSTDKKGDYVQILDRQEEQVGELIGPFLATVSSISFSPNGRKILIAQYVGGTDVRSQVLTLWEINNPGPARLIKDLKDKRVSILDSYHVKLHPNEKWVAIHYSNKFIVLDYTRSDARGELGLVSEMKSPGLHYLQFKFSRDGNSLLAAGSLNGDRYHSKSLISADPNIDVFDGQEIENFSGMALVGEPGTFYSAPKHEPGFFNHSSFLLDIEISNGGLGHEVEISAMGTNPDGSILVSGDKSGIVNYWDLNLLLEGDIDE